MLDCSPRKRAREEAHEDGAEGIQAESRVKDEEFWYADGNVILVARGVEFRVFKGILAEHSPVFETMFSLPQSSSAPDVPVVDLLDSPEDIRHVLRAIMPRSAGIR